MNSRINELAVQANKEFGLGFSPEKVAESHEFLQKFAELIIEECCELLRVSGDDWERFANDPPKEQAHNADAALFAAYRLKEDAVTLLKTHFGLSE